jgi:hypothetical protein
LVRGARPSRCRTVRGRVRSGVESSSGRAAPMAHLPSWHASCAVDPLSLSRRVSRGRDTHSRRGRRSRETEAGLLEKEMTPVAAEQAAAADGALRRAQTGRALGRQRTSHTSTRLGVALIRAMPKPAPDNVHAAAKKVRKDTVALQLAWGEERYRRGARPAQVGYADRQCLGHPARPPRILLAAPRRDVPSDRERGSGEGHQRAGRAGVPRRGQGRSYGVGHRARRDRPLDSLREGQARRARAGGTADAAPEAVASPTTPLPTVK